MHPGTSASAKGFAFEGTRSACAGEKLGGVSEALARAITMSEGQVARAQMILVLLKERTRDSKGEEIIPTQEEDEAPIKLKAAKEAAELLRRVLNGK